MPESPGRRYADTTKIPAAQTAFEIQALLTKKGASAFMYGESATDVAIAFEMESIRYRFVVPIPPEEADEVRFTPRGVERNATARKDAREQLKRARMRALLLLLKAKLEAVAIGASTLEEELLPAVVMPNGQTVAQWARPQIMERYALGQMPPLLALGPGGGE